MPDASYGHNSDRPKPIPKILLEQSTEWKLKIFLVKNKNQIVMKASIWWWMLMIRKFCSISIHYVFVFAMMKSFEMNFVFCWWPLSWETTSPTMDTNDDDSFMDFDHRKYNSKYVNSKIMSCISQLRLTKSNPSRLWIRTYITRQNDGLKKFCLHHFDIMYNLCVYQ